MANIDSTLLILLALAALGIISHNNTVTIAILILLVFRLITPLNVFFPWIQKYGLTVGIIMLTVAVMVPIANGKITADIMLRSFTQWKSIVAIIIGVFVSWLGMRGVTLMSHQPTIISGLIVGTLLGVALFKGVPVGPLIAAGLLSLLIGKG